MKKFQTKLTAAGLLISGLLVTDMAMASGRLTVYCSARNTVCEQQVKTFQEKFGVKTSFIRSSSGTVLAKLQAEKNNPQGDVWYGGTFDSHSQAAEMGLLTQYKSKYLDDVMPKFKDPGKLKGNYSSVVYMGVLGFGVNTERLKKLGIKKVPKCWKDLTDPRLKGEVQVADAQSSGTAYTAVATFVQLWGEDEAFKYMKKLHKNISQYTKSGTAPSKNIARNETTIGIGFLQNYSFEREKGAPLDVIVPCEGTGYELGGVSLIKNARNEKNAKLFIDWVMSKESQESLWRDTADHHILTNVKAEASPFALKPSELNLINYDFSKYGSKDLRGRLIDKWLNEVKLAK
ncbi:ABC transporter substrate-binding protein [Phocoenobacter atlanticus]|uniref:ABC transporter substrate-binding protein n=1 Tax=Phocoenobacter atlanticus TaxID=3416742 RepID=UPI002742F65D|nr:ABC transporter substrate-binding protein [Pasteurella atlantica]MDP8101164.1 ABC transporter substrate-binding protein [Pasteurella atlantica]